MKFGTNLGMLDNSNNLPAMDNEHLYFLKVSGTVQPAKQREFKQTVLFVFNHLPSSCISRNLALDLHQPDLYHVYCLWRSREALIAFRSSNEFVLLKGAFETLGTYRDAIAGVRTDINLFEVSDVFDNFLSSASTPRIRSKSLPETFQKVAVKADREYTASRK